MLTKNVADYGWCLDENGEDQNRGAITFKGLPNSHTALDCLEKCLNQTNIKGCEYDEHAGINGGGGCEQYAGNGNGEDVIVRRMVRLRTMMLVVQMW